MKTTPLTLREDLASAYLRYVDTAFWLRNEQLMRERRQVLQSRDMLLSECLLEPVLPYPATEDLLDTTRQVGISDETALIVGKALFGSFVKPGEPIRLREHQAKAVLHHFKPGARRRSERRGHLGNGLGQDGEVPLADPPAAHRGGSSVGASRPRQICGGGRSRTPLNGVRCALLKTARPPFEL